MKKGEKKENTKQTAALACGEPPVRAGRAKFLPDYWESVTQHTHAQTASTRFHTSSGAKKHTFLRMSRQRRAQYRITTLIRKGKKYDTHTQSQYLRLVLLCLWVESTQEGKGGNTVPLEAEWTRGNRGCQPADVGVVSGDLKIDSQKKGPGRELRSVTKISLYFLVNNSSRISSRIWPCCG